MARRSGTLPQVTHAVRGRIRVNVGTQATDAQRESMLSALQTLGERPGMRTVTTDNRTGSALLTYNPSELSPEAVIDLVREAHAALAELNAPGVADLMDQTSAAARAIAHRFETADQRVLVATDGRLDLRMLVPVVLGGLSVRQFARQGVDLKSIPWYVLAWYSFDSFIKLHAGRGFGPGPQTVAATVEQQT